MNSAAAYGGGIFIVDKSAWERARKQAVLQAEWSEAARAGQLRTCAVTKLELLYSTRTSAEFEEWAAALSAFAEVPVTRTVCNAALGAMAELAGMSDGRHRIDPPDYLIAAAAQDVGVGVLHYDRHFDRLSTVLAFESRWIAPAGSVP